MDRSKLVVEIKIESEKTHVVISGGKYINIWWQSYVWLGIAIDSLDANCRVRDIILAAKIVVSQVKLVNSSYNGCAFISS